MPTNATPMPTTQVIYDLIHQLHDALLDEYYGDFAFTVMADGNVIAASNTIHGIVMPVVKDDYVDDVPMNQPDLRG